MCTQARPFSPLHVPIPHLQVMRPLVLGPSASRPAPVPYKKTARPSCFVPRVATTRGHVSPSARPGRPEPPGSAGIRMPQPVEPELRRPPADIWAPPVASFRPRSAPATTLYRAHKSAPSRPQTDYERLHALAARHRVVKVHVHFHDFLGLSGPKKCQNFLKIAP